MTDTTDNMTAGTSDAFVDELSTELWATSWRAFPPSKRERCTRYWTLHAMAGAGDTCILNINALHFPAFGGQDGRG
ncbi:hypothetical protein B0T13DRAFT_485452 [Neurospora crassa]|nr:hypothetical protein B0T13DRAFT_485452 [Neurospora crassa]